MKLQLNHVLKVNRDALMVLVFDSHSFIPLFIPILTTMDEYCLQFVPSQTAQLDCFYF